MWKVQAALGDITSQTSNRRCFSELLISDVWRFNCILFARCEPRAHSVVAFWHVTRGRRSSITMEIFLTRPLSTDFTFGRGKAAVMYQSSAGGRNFDLAPREPQSSNVFGRMIGIIFR